MSDEPTTELKEWPRELLLSSPARDAIAALKNDGESGKAHLVAVRDYLKKHSDDLSMTAGSLYAIVDLAVRINRCNARTSEFLVKCDALERAAKLLYSVVEEIDRAIDSKDYKLGNSNPHLTIIVSTEDAIRLVIQLLANIKKMLLRLTQVTRCARMALNFWGERNGPQCEPKTILKRKYKT